MKPEYLVAVDGSPEGEHALEHALDITDAKNGVLTVVYAVQPDIYKGARDEPISGLSDAYRRDVLQSIDDAEDRGQEILKDAVAIAENHEQDIETELLYGNPITEIPDYIEEEGFDAIFIGHRGQTERSDIGLGSVANAIVERTTVPVTIVR